MEAANTTLSPALSLPPGTLRWDGWLLVACVALGLPANAFTLWFAGWRLRGQGLACFILSLATSDLLFLANSILQIWSVANSHQWLLGTSLCQLHQFLYALGYYSSLFLLATISLDRCLLVAAPLWYRCRRPARLPLALCLGAWAAAAACSVPDTVLAEALELQWAPGFVACITLRGSWEVPMRWLEVLVEGLLPFGVVMVCHGVALALASCRRGHGGRPPVRFQRILVATVSLYVALHLPFQVAQLLTLVAPGTSEHLIYLLGLAFNLNSCINPCLYLLFGTTSACQCFTRLPLLARRPATALAQVPPTALSHVPPAPVTPVTAATGNPVPAATGNPVPAATDNPVPTAATTSVPPTAVSPVPLPPPQCQ
ncbi:probable G-protein coupled receptor 152 [Dryobates pubescens]|uniref:probable G-protein coupled receptor 152 n=1 Tax=Dryobates pubescens TaxID=118200 RepID=UPI0023BA2F04|nr:probable G-protein coupled receptor 152 [Dryobates pubescens]